MLNYHYLKIIMKKDEFKLMTAAEYVADRGENLDKAIAGDIFEIM